MDGKESFCINCDRFVETDLHIYKVEVTIRNVKFLVDEHELRCKRCGESVYNPDINDLNVKLRLSAYYDAVEAMKQNDGGTCSR